MWGIVAAAAMGAYLANGGKLSIAPPTPWEELERARMERLDRQRRHDAMVNMAFLIAIFGAIITLIAWCLL